MVWPPARILWVLKHFCHPTKELLFSIHDYTVSLQQARDSTAGDAIAVEIRAQALGSDEEVEAPGARGGRPFLLLFQLHELIPPGRTHLMFAFWLPFQAFLKRLPAAGSIQPVFQCSRIQVMG